MEEGGFLPDSSAGMKEGGFLPDSSAGMKEGGFLPDSSAGMKEGGFLPDSSAGMKEGGFLPDSSAGMEEGEIPGTVQPLSCVSNLISMCCTEHMPQQPDIFILELYRILKMVNLD